VLNAICIIDGFARRDTHEYLLRIVVFPKKIVAISGSNERNSEGSRSIYTYRIEALLLGDLVRLNLQIESLVVDAPVKIQDLIDPSLIIEASKMGKLAC
jgi:hypothetical protein